MAIRLTHLQNVEYKYDFAGVDGTVNLKFFSSPGSVDIDLLTLKSLSVILGLMSFTISDNSTDLVFAANQGDRSALECLFSRYLPRVRQIVALRLGYPIRDFFQYEDIVQESLLKVFNGLGTFDTKSEARFRNWLAKCVANNIREYFRKTKTIKFSRTLPSYPYSSDLILKSILDEKSPSPSEYLECHECADKIEAALLRMKKSYREIIIYSQICGMSVSEIAQAMKLENEDNVRKLRSRALNKLGELMAEKG